jgi:hypothetical protein
VKRPEQSLQRSIIQGLRIGLPHGWIVAHVPNGGKRTKVEGAIFKAMGVVPGMPDIMVMGVRHFDETKPLDAPEPYCCFFEVKSGRGVITDVQRACHDRLMDLGFHVAVVTSWDQTVQFAREWGLPLRVS